MAPGERGGVVVDMYPQEDLIEAGQRLRITVGSDDDGRTIESYDEGVVALDMDAGKPTYLKLFTRPEALQGTRLG